jgi:hypothetical protein
MIQDGLDNIYPVSLADNPSYCRAEVIADWLSNSVASTLSDELAVMWQGAWHLARKLALGKEVGTWQGSWHLARKLALGKEVGTWHLVTWHLADSYI